MRFADRVTLFDVVEHVPHPLSFLKRVSELLQPVGSNHFLVSVTEQAV